MSVREPITKNQMEELQAVCSIGMKRFLPILFEYQDEYEEAKELMRGRNTPTHSYAFMEFRSRKIQRLSISWEEFQSDINEWGYKDAIIRLFQEPMTDKTLEHITKKYHRGLFTWRELYDFHVNDPNARYNLFIGTV